MHKIDQPLLWTLSGSVSMNPEVCDDIHLEDISHSLSFLSRFGGHIKRFYSVAEHSVNVSRFVPKHLRMKALLHDAGEAYINDIPTPVKHLSPHIISAEEIFMRKISKRFKIDEGCEPLIKQADSFMLYLEALELTNIPRDVVAKFLRDRNPQGLTAEQAELLIDAPKRGIYVIGLPPQKACKFFMQEYERILNDKDC